MIYNTHMDTRYSLPHPRTVSRIHTPKRVEIAVAFAALRREELDAGNEAIEASKALEKYQRVKGKAYSLPVAMRPPQAMLQDTQRYLSRAMPAIDCGPPVSLHTAGTRHPVPLARWCEIRGKRVTRRCNGVKGHEHCSELTLKALFNANAQSHPRKPGRTRRGHSDNPQKHTRVLREIGYRIAIT